jgi:SOS-response transcriptional repressor LexA
MAVDGKDLFLQAGVAVTLVLGVVNLYFTLKAGKRTTFINTVTSERVKWIGKVRQNMASLCSLCDQWMNHPQQASAPALQQHIEQLKAEVTLQMNPGDPEDKEIARLLARLPSWTRTMTQEEYMKLHAALITATQAMLKREWDKVKAEAVHGDLR